MCVLKTKLVLILRAFLNMKIASESEESSKTPIKKENAREKTQENEGS